MKICKLIKWLQNIEKRDGNIEVLIADRALSCNHMHGEHREIGIFKTSFELANGEERDGMLLAVEDPQDSTPPSDGELERFEE
jgi:hypothetical protein